MNFIRGQRDLLNKYVDVNAEILVKMRITGPAVYDFCCFGLRQGKLADDRYMVFYNQPSSPQREIRISLQGTSATFAIQLGLLPLSIDKLVFAASVDGTGTMGEITSQVFDVEQNGETKIHMEFTGSDFMNQKSIIVADIYQKNGWRIQAVADGFNGGLPRLLESFGGSHTQTDSTATPASPDLSGNPSAAPSIAQQPSQPAANASPNSPQNANPRSSLSPNALSMAEQIRQRAQNPPAASPAPVPARDAQPNPPAPGGASNALSRLTQKFRQRLLDPTAGSASAPSATPDPASGASPARQSNSADVSGRAKDAPLSSSAPSVRQSSEESVAERNPAPADSGTDEIARRIFDAAQLPNNGAFLRAYIQALSGSIADMSRELGADMSAIRARTAVAIDGSDSMRGLFRTGLIQKELNRFLPLGPAFDPRSAIDVFWFQDAYKQADSLTAANCLGYASRLESVLKGSSAGTMYAPVLQAIISGDALTRAPLGNSGSGAPTLILFVSDGYAWDKTETENLLRKASDQNVFIQFVGVGNGDFTFLKGLTRLAGADQNHTGFSCGEDGTGGMQEGYTMLLRRFFVWMRDRMSP